MGRVGLDYDYDYDYRLHRGGWVGGSDQMIKDYIFVTDQTSAFHKFLYLYIG